MMSNSTPNLLPQDNQNPFSTPHNASTHPNSAAVVSQTQTETLPESRFEALLAATQDSLSDLHDDALLSQMPIISSPTQPIILATTQASPDTIHINGTNLFGHLDVIKCNYCHDSNKQRLAKRQKARKGVDTSMLTFLHEERISARIQECDEKMAQIHSGFSCQCTVWKPFKILCALLTDMTRTKQLLTPDHHGLMFKEFLALCPGTAAILLLCYNHPILNDKRTWMPIMRSALVNNPIVTRIIVGKQLFVFEAIVRSNRHADAFANKTLTESEIERYCGLREGSEICLDIVGTNQDSRCLHTLDFF